VTVERIRFGCHNPDKASIGRTIFQMKRPIIPVALMALIFSSCNAHRYVSNNNSSSQKPVGQSSLSQPQTQKPCINLNAATIDELKDLPGIGEVMARRVIDYREGHGLFHRAEEIIIVEGFSEKKYRAIAHRICIE
jgi:competence ComEA-like helix-hairpin-helix protein